MSISQFFNRFRSPPSGPQSDIKVGNAQVGTAQASGTSLKAATTLRDVGKPSWVSRFLSLGSSKSSSVETPLASRTATRQDSMSIRKAEHRMSSGWSERARDFFNEHMYDISDQVRYRDAKGSYSHGLADEAARDPIWRGFVSTLRGLQDPEAGFDQHLQKSQTHFLACLEIALMDIPASAGQARLTRLDEQILFTKAMDVMRQRPLSTVTPSPKD